VAKAIEIKLCRIASVWLSAIQMRAGREKILVAGLRYFKINLVGISFSKEGSCAPRVGNGVGKK